MCFYYNIIQNLRTDRIFVSFTTSYRRGRKKKMEMIFNLLYTSHSPQH